LPVSSSHATPSAPEGSTAIAGKYDWPVLLETATGDEKVPPPSVERATTTSRFTAPPAPFRRS
jgi:hypothetical protein